MSASLGGLDLRLLGLRATFRPAYLAEYECIHNGAYLELGHTNRYCILALAFSGNADPGDPSVRYVDNDAFSEIEATDHGVPLSRFLAGVRPAE